MKFIIKPTDSGYVWYLRPNDNGLPAICRCAFPLASYKAARFDIARAKKSLSGAKFAKVEEHG